MKSRAERFAALSYHSWEIALDRLERDIDELRQDGWHIVTAAQALAALRGESAPAAKCCLVTSDDGHEEDARFFDRLDKLACPGTTFVNLGRIDPARLPFFRELDRHPAHSVEDHGLLHRRHFTSGLLLGFMNSEARVSGIGHLQLQPGTPLCATGSEVAFPRFDPLPEALTAAATLDTASEEGARQAVQLLLDRGLADQRNGEVHVRGRTEAPAEHVSRVRSYLESGRERFADTFGRMPRWYAYTWWQGSSVVDEILRELGYEGSFAGTGADVACDGRTFSVQRVRADTRLPRPLPLQRDRQAAPLQMAANLASALRRLLRTS